MKIREERREGGRERREGGRGREGGRQNHESTHFSFDPYTPIMRS